MTLPAIFLYGTLCWDELLIVVGGPDCPRATPATLNGYSTHWVEGQTFPMVQMNKGAMCHGLLVRDAPFEVMDRLSYYEAPFGYVLAEVTVEGPDGPEDAYAYRPPKDLIAGDDWDLAGWIATHGPLARETATEVMARMHLDTPAQAKQKYGMMQVRAAGRLNATAHPSPVSDSGLSMADVDVQATHVPYSNFFAMGEVALTHKRFDGTQTDSLNRAAFLGTDAAIVLPYDPIRDRVLLIEQFRFGPFMRNDANPWMMEPVAGRVDAGEAPDVTAKREAVEEAGLTLTDLHLVHSGYASPGCSTEYFHIYVGIADLPDDVAQIGGLPGEAEDIKGHVLPWDTFYDRLTNGQLPVTPLALAGYWLAHNRATLRQTG
ncbi:MAG: NUDIX domain-containing protein [Planktomarina sp.]